MDFAILLGSLVALNSWVTHRVLRMGELLDKKGLHIAMVWIAPFAGAFMTWLHLVPLERQRKAGHAVPAAKLPEPLPEAVSAAGVSTLVLSDVLRQANGFPMFDWPVVETWLAGIGDAAARAEARLTAQRAWLQHLAGWIGPHVELTETEHALVLSSLERPVAAAMARYVGRARHTIGQVLGRLGQFEPGHKSIVLVLDDEDWYYHYVSIYYPAEGEFSFSSGMFLNAGCPHFVVVRADLTAVEPVIAHELTHSALARLELPLWLDEGIAVNTERKVAGAARGLYTPHELRSRHHRFWGDDTIQEFWSGASFHRTDDGNLLSYDLARILTEQMAQPWDAFERFVLDADRSDAGASAAAEHLGVDLGATVCALFEQPASPAWSPRAVAA